MAVLRQLGCVVVLALAGCSPTSHQGFAKTNVNYGVASRDDTACRVEANQLFPSATFTTTSPGYGGIYGGFYGGGGWGFSGSYVHVSDANASLRSEHRRDCMALKGYRAVTHPVCTSAQLDSGNYSPVDGAPLPAENYCIASAQGGGRVLIDLSKPL